MWWLEGVLQCPNAELLLDNRLCVRYDRTFRANAAGIKEGSNQSDHQDRAPAKTAMGKRHSPHGVSPDIQAAAARWYEASEKTPTNPRSRRSCPSYKQARLIRRRS